LVECPLLVDVPFFETPKGKQNLMKNISCPPTIHA
jgi:hypothetical protein